MFSVSTSGSVFSFLGDGTSVMLTGSELPSNQLASLSTAPVGLLFVTDGSAETADSAVSATETLSGDNERVLCGRKKGRKAEARVGDDD